MSATQSPALTTVKSSTATTYATVGQALPYKYVVSNTGNTTLTTAVTVTDDKIASVSCPALPAGGLAPGASLTCAASYLVTQADIDGGNILNHASATSGLVTSPIVSYSISGAQAPKLQVMKSSATTSYAAVGQSIPYTYTVTNTGNTTLTTPATVADNKIASVSCAAFPAGGLPVGGSVTCAGTYSVTQADIDAGSLVNSAVATSGFGATTITSNTASKTIPAAQTASLSLAKSAPAAPVTAAGQILPYTFDVTNSGNTTIISPVTVSDNKVSSVTCPALPPGGLAPGAVISCSGAYTVTQADIDAGSIVNTATAKSGAFVSTPPTVHTQPAAQAPALAVIKTPVSASYAAVGQVLAYTYKVTNSGNTTLTAAVTATDDKVASVSCPALPTGGLAPGAAITCTGSYTVKQSDIDAGLVTNNASATSGATKSATVSATVAAAQNSALTVVKTSPTANYSAVGQSVSYSYKVTNSGNTTLTTAITVSDNKAAGAVCPALPAGGLTPGAFITCAASYSVTQADIDSGSLTNTASARSGSTLSPTVSATVNAALAPALSLAKTSTATTFTTVGQSIPYSYAVRNTGNTTLTSPVTVTDNRIASVICPALPSAGLAPGATLTCSAAYAVTQADIDAGAVTNAAAAKSGTTVSPTVSATVSAARTPGMTLRKTPAASTFNAVGQTIPYSYRVTNSGNTTLTALISVSDNKIASVSCPALPAGGLAPGAFITCSGSYSVVQADIDAGSLTNTASAASGPVTSPAVSATLTAAQSPALTTVKSSIAASYSTVGQSLPYTYLVTNSGNTTLTAPVSVSDSKIAAVTCPALPTGGLAPGMSLTCTGAYSVTQGDIDAGSVSNSASAKSGATISPTVTKTVNAVKNAGLAVVKTPGSATFTVAGQAMPYTYKVTNTGNTTFTTAITVTDNKIASVTCPALPPGGLAPGASLTCAGTYTVTQADLNSGSVTNTASARSGPASSPPVSATVNGAQTPALITVKGTTATGFSAVGQSIPYTYVVTNSGNTTLTNPVSVTDSKITSVTCPALPTGGLVPGAALTCTANYAVTQADIDAGVVANTASSRSGTTQSPVVAKSVPAAQGPAIAIVKSTAATTFNAAGQQIVYSYKVTNTGNTTFLTPVSVTDNKITAVVCPPFATGSFAPGASLTCTGTYTVRQADIDAGFVTNTASAKSGAITTPAVVYTLTAAQNPALTMLKTSVAQPFTAVGQVIAYSYKVTNSGNTTLTAPVTVTDNKISAVACPALAAGGLLPGAFITCTASYAVTQADVDTGSVTNAATAKSGAVISPAVTLSIAAAQKAGLTIVKTSPATSFNAAGQSIPYSYLVTNTGNITLTVPVTVKDDKIPAVTCAAPPAGGLAPGASVTCTGIYAITQADLDSGTLLNNASANSGPSVNSTTVKLSIAAAQAPALAMVKATTANTFTAVGEKLTFTYTLTNTGNTSFPGPFTVTDNKIPAVTCPAPPGGGLVPAGVLVCTGVYSVVQADLNTGSVTNTAAAKTGATTSAGTSVTVTGTQNPAMTLVKAAVKPTALNNGDGTFTGTFSVAVANSGNVDLTDMQITDDFAATLPAGMRVTGAVISALTSSTRGALSSGSGSYSGAGDTAALLAGKGETLAVGEKISAVLTLSFDPGADPTVFSIDNTALALSIFSPGTPQAVSVSKKSTATITFTPNTPLIVTKTTPKTEVVRGELVPYTVTVRSSTPVTRTGLTLVDVIPAGFKYKDRSATIDGVPAEPAAAGRKLSWKGLTVAGLKPVTIKLILVIGSGVGRGEFTNEAWVTNAAGAVLSNTGRATVRLVADPTFDCTDIIGKVFDDVDQSGYPDDGKRGIANVRLATARGQLITTDSEGRFHVACADIPETLRGTNFILKLDERTLPSGYRMTTENPRVIRITQGKLAKINFGAALQHVVRVDLADAAFEPGSAELKAAWAGKMANLTPLLLKQTGVLRIAYRRGAAEQAELAGQRIRALTALVRSQWASAGAPYELSIETEIYQDRARSR